MRLFGSSKNDLKCKKCGTVLPDSERLKKHQEKAHNKKKEKCRACGAEFDYSCLLYTSPSPRDRTRSRMPSSA